MFDKPAPILAGAACLVLLSPVVASAADENPADGGERCVDIKSISRTDVIDDQNILFYMRGGVIYQNKLAYRCSGLRSERTFMYRTSLSRLCNVDVITVLYNQGFGFSQGASCGLGRFYPVSKEEAQALKEAPTDLEPAEVPPAEPEEPEIEQ